MEKLQRPSKLFKRKRTAGQKQGMRFWPILRIISVGGGLCVYPGGLHRRMFCGFRSLCTIPRSTITFIAAPVTDNAIHSLETEPSTRRFGPRTTVRYFTFFRPLHKSKLSLFSLNTKSPQCLLARQRPLDTKGKREQIGTFCTQQFLKIVGTCTEMTLQLRDSGRTYLSQEWRDGVFAQSSFDWKTKHNCCISQQIAFIFFHRWTGFLRNENLIAVKRKKEEVTWCKARWS